MTEPRDWHYKGLNVEIVEGDDEQTIEFKVLHMPNPNTTAVYAITSLDREKAREVAEWILANT